MNQSDTTGDVNELVEAQTIANVTLAMEADLDPWVAKFEPHMSQSFAVCYESLNPYKLLMFGPPEDSYGFQCPCGFLFRYNP